MKEIEGYHFEVPEAQIAQAPLKARSQSRLMVIPRGGGELGHHIFEQIVDLIPDNATLVFNNTKVIPARLLGKRPGGGKVEVLLVDSAEEVGENHWLAWIRPSNKVREGMILSFDGELQVRVKERRGRPWLVELMGPGDITALLEAVGHMPLPPYIKRPDGENDRERYQTVYAQEPGAAAAPTAGLHFTEEILSALQKRGVKTEFITLHVGPGTFAPLSEESLNTGLLHQERYHIDPAVWQRLMGAKSRGERIVCVGTTAVRTLEAAASDLKCPQLSGTTRLFIRPGYQFKMVDHLVTNFHLPSSSLLMLVAAFAGHDVIMDAYRVAVERGYRFFSYGDASIIL